MEGLTANQASLLSSLDANNASDYKQLTTSLGGVLRQYNDLNIAVGSIPTTETRTTQVSNFGAPSTAYVTIATQTFTVPPGKRIASAFAELDLTPGATGGDANARTRVNVGGYISVAPATATAGIGSSYTSLGVSFPVKPGNTFNITYQFAANATAIPTSPANIANCNALVTWT